MKVVDALKSSALDDAAAVAKVFHNVKDMRGEEDGVALRGVLAHDLFQLVRALGVKARERLVKHPELRVVDERRDHRDLLLHSVGIAFDRVVVGRPQLKDVKEALGALRGLRGIDAVEVGDMVDVFLPRQPLKHRVVIRDVADLPLRCEGVGPDRHPVDQDIPVLEGVDARQRLDGRRFAGAVRPQKAVDLPRPQGEREVLNGIDLGFPIAFGEVADGQHIHRGLGRLGGEHRILVFYHSVLRSVRHAHVVF